MALGLRPHARPPPPMHFFCGRYDQAAALARKTAREQPGFLPALRIAAASAALEGRLDEARKAMSRLREIDPLQRSSALREQIPLRRDEDVRRLADGLEKAGLPP